METGKNGRIKQLRERLANLTEQEKAKLAERGLIATVEGRCLSPNNSVLCYLQAGGSIPTVVGGYKQWRAAGKQVQQGQHGFIIWFPVGDKDEDGDIINAERFYTGVVFDISQVA